MFHAHDGYTTNVRLDQFDQPDVFLVHQWDGQPITRQHGGPVRVLIPRLYLWKSAKWVRRIELDRAGPPRVLGGARLPQQRRSVAGGALRLSGRRVVRLNKLRW